MKKLILTIAILVALTSQAFAWTKVETSPDGIFSVDEKSIVHYTAKGGFEATEGIYSVYTYSDSTEVLFKVQARDTDLAYVITATCTWINGNKIGCNVPAPKLKLVSRGSYGEAVLQWMVNYGKKTKGDDIM